MNLAVADFLTRISGGLALYYVILAALNWIVAWIVWQRGSNAQLCTLGPKRRVPRLAVTRVGALIAAGAAFHALALAAYCAHPFPQWRFFPFEPWLAWFWDHTMSALNYACGPVPMTLGSLALGIAVILARRCLARPLVAWTIFNLLALFIGAALTNATFYGIVLKPDNIPAAIFLFAFGLFGWLLLYSIVQTEARRRQPTEFKGSHRARMQVLGLAAMCVIVLLVIGMFLAPSVLEEPASNVQTPNPSKAPWYFLGLQELLVYIDPWLAGVLPPLLVILVPAVGIPLAIFWLIRFFSRP